MTARRAPLPAVLSALLALALPVPGRAAPPAGGPAAGPEPSASAPASAPSAASPAPGTGTGTGTGTSTSAPAPPRSARGAAAKAEAAPRKPKPKPLSAWPVRLNLALPLGGTIGDERFHGFTWGFRGVVQLYPTSGRRGLAVGAQAELLLDAKTHKFATLGGVITAPVASWTDIDLRAGGTAAALLRDAATGHGADLALGVVLQAVLPAYLYDLTLGLRVVGTFDRGGPSMVAILVDVDLAVVLSLFALAGGIR